MGESFIRSMQIFIAINEKSRYWEEKLSMKTDDDGFNLCTRQLIPVFDQVFTYPCKIVNKNNEQYLDVHGSDRNYVVSKLGYNLLKGLITYLYRGEITQLLSTRRTF